jgi:hypothetical protein
LLFDLSGEIGGAGLELGSPPLADGRHKVEYYKAANLTSKSTSGSV